MDLKRVDRVFRAFPKDERFFAYFDQLVAVVVDACELLARFVDDAEGGAETLALLKAAERRGDEISRDILSQLNKSFTTPIDREDIQALAGALDGVVDGAHGAASFSMATGQPAGDPYLRRLAAVLVDCAREIARAVEHLNDGESIAERAAALHALESAGDAVYAEALGALFAGTPDPIRVVRLKDLYAQIESTIDLCKGVANILDTIVLKNG